MKVIATIGPSSSNKKVLSELINNGVDVFRLNFSHFYQREFIRILNDSRSIKKDIKVKVEVAFMPYKASMWDYLESIWVAANEDENCDAYVVPIPYYERNLDGSLGQFHYEGREFPYMVGNETGVTGFYKADALNRK